MCLLYNVFHLSVEQMSVYESASVSVFSRQNNTTGNFKDVTRNINFAHVKS